MVRTMIKITDKEQNRAKNQWLKSNKLASERRRYKP
jgi:hypothetical protein